ncbi:MULTISPECIES: SseB family protein [Streptomyces]|uniref:SseB family protein n=1 Tax=Streptomyces TaxID=1883 RepID=UPI00200F8B8B|nr:SseB family protein [Streptomyces sp. LRE541]UPZ33030.1 SseB family protein [Streptomyces sp. LRE541]
MTTTDVTGEDTADVILRALSVLAYDGGDPRARATLADSDVLIPSYGPDDDGGDPTKLNLPVTERTVLVFTSEARMIHSLPGVRYYCVVPLGTLPAYWPERNPSLTIDAGSPDSVMLTAEGVRTLLSAGGR